MNSHNVTEQADIIRHQPADADEALMRALFYAHCLHGLCKRQINSLLNSCEAGELGAAAQEAVQSGIPDHAFGAAVKVLTCMSLHMLGLDRCGEGGPAWLMQFVFEALKETDEQTPDPPAVAIIEQHGAWKRDRMCFDVAQHACEILGLPVSNRQLVEALYNFLQSSAIVRDETLLFALSQPPEALRRHLEVFG